jgi:hypothetical protein
MFKIGINSTPKIASAEALESPEAAAQPAEQEVGSAESKSIAFGNSSMRSEAMFSSMAIRAYLTEQLAKNVSLEGNSILEQNAPPLTPEEANQQISNLPDYDSDNKRILAEAKEYQGTDFSSSIIGSIYTGGLSKPGPVIGSINTDGLNDSVPLYVKGRGDDNSVAMNDVKQGLIGDCWMLAPLASVASKDPEAIKNMIQKNGDGSFTVTFKQNAWPLLGYVEKKVTVNAGFLGFATGPGDANAKGQTEIWPQIIEKAYAKLKGGYDKIEGGNPGEFLEALTGAPATTYIPVIHPFEQLENDFNSGKNVIFSTRDTIPDVYNLKKNHAYAVNRFYTDPNSGRQMVELYNPWGQEHARIPYDEAYQYFENIQVNDQSVQS